MGQKYLIDSNVLINFQAMTLPESGQQFVAYTIDNEFYISVISKIEVLGHKSATVELENFISLASIFDLNNDIISSVISMRKQHKIKLPDAIIAATALIHNLTLVTRNTKDFENIAGLQVINPWKL